MRPVFSFRRRFLVAATALACVAPAAVLAQSGYPSKPIKFVVGYPAGGSVDQMGRVIGEAMARRLNGVAVVENLGGAAGAIGAQRVVNSAPDGYTLLAGSSNELVATRQINPAQRYDARKDLTPIGMVAWAPVILAAGPKTGISSLAELVAEARKHPGKYSYGSSGVGSTLHFAGELFKQQAGLAMTHIPYRGVAPLTSDLVGGSLDLAVLSPTAAVPFIKTGRIKPLAVTGSKRIPSLPDVPAMNELPELKNYELAGWFAIMAPRGLPEALRSKLAETLQQTLQDPAVRANLEAAGMEMATGREDLGKLLADESAKYAQLVKFGGMRE